VRLTIERFSSKHIKTTKGDSILLNFQAGGVRYNAFAGDWNAHWKNGTVLDVDPSQIKINEKDGITFTNIRAPANARPETESASGNASADTTERTLKAVTLIYRDVQKIKKALGIEEG
jgi:hypothetical protein